MEGGTRTTRAEILSALSHALDITEGQATGHAVRTCLLATHLGRTIGLGEHDLESLYYAALLKDAGSSANSPRLQRLFGEDDSRSRSHFSEWHNSFLGFNIRRIRASKAPSAELVAELTATRCQRGSEIARQLGFGEGAAEAILCIEEHWDGSGGPQALQGDRIPLVSRILSLAQTLELFARAQGPQRAVEVVKARSGRWFDPELVRGALALAQDNLLWEEYAVYLQPNAPALVPPEGAQAETDSGLDEICEAFSRIVDAKSSFTYQHSTRVMNLSVAGGQRLGVTDLPTLRRAALLHDIGKLGVSSAILDKNGPLDDRDWHSVREHPKHSYEILSRITGFRRIAEIAGAHHERLDGRGYWRGVSAVNLDLEMRVLACADVFDALSAERPYRPAMPLPEVYRIMKSDAGLDQSCVEALWDAVAVNRTLCGGLA
ncbi:MAG TPA: HD domain-containing phosphohydrolase [Fimbriimonas sp.]